MTGSFRETTKGGHYHQDQLEPTQTTIQKHPAQLQCVPQCMPQCVVVWAALPFVPACLRPAQVLHPLMAMVIVMMVVTAVTARQDTLWCRQ
jgi:hypothetical protein